MIRAAAAGASLLVLLGTVVVVVRGRAEPTVSYARDVQPIFDRSCVACHPVAYPYLDLRPARSWSQLVRVPAATDLAFARVLPGHPELSYLLTHPVDPSNATLLSASDRRVIARWIRAGAHNN